MKFEADVVIKVRAYIDYAPGETPREEITDDLIKNLISQLIRDELEWSSSPPMDVSDLKVTSLERSEKYE